MYLLFYPGYEWAEGLEDKMQGSKNFMKSKGVWGSLGAMFGGILAFFQIDVPAEQLEQTFTSLGVAVSGLIALWGRITAKQSVSLKGDAGPGFGVFCLIVFMFLFSGCSSTQGLHSGKAKAIIDYETHPVMSADGSITSYENYVERCEVSVESPARKEGMDVTLDIKEDCSQAKVKINADLVDPTHAQTVASEIEKERAKLFKDFAQSIADGILGGLKPGP